MNALSPSFTFREGASPLLISMPHAGTDLPQGFADRLTEAARSLPDTDWHLPRLYDFPATAEAALIAARWSRYAIDLNRPPDDAKLYAGPTTGLYPEILFDGSPVFQPGQVPDAAARQAYREMIWQPYHDRLASALREIRARHGFALLLDAHSIRSRVPLLFAGRLPDFNIGSHEGKSADPDLIRRLAAISAASPYSHVVDGRFKGGYITRRYGDPAAGIHVVQLELAQETYMDESPPFAFREDRAARLRPHLEAFVAALASWRPQAA